MNKRRDLRRVIAGAVVTVAAPAIMALPVAKADAPLCDPHLVGTVSSAINGYLGRHSDVNQALIDINNSPPEVVSGLYDDYFAAHPDVASALRGYAAPLGNAQCLNDALPPQVVNALLAL